MFFSTIILWTALGLFGILASVVVAVFADRVAHRRHLAAMSEAFEKAITCRRAITPIAARARWSAPSCKARMRSSGCGSAHARAGDRLRRNPPSGADGDQHGCAHGRDPRFDCRRLCGHERLGDAQDEDRTGECRSLQLGGLWPGRRRHRQCHRRPEFFAHQGRSGCHACRHGRSLSPHNIRC